MRIEEGPTYALPPDMRDIVFYYKQFSFESRIFLYSIDFAVVVDPMEDDEFMTHRESCIVTFVGEEDRIVAYSDVNR